MSFESMKRIIEFVENQGEDIAVQCNNILNHFHSTLVDSGIEEFYKNTFPNLDMEIIETCIFRYEVDMFANYLPQSDIISFNISKKECRFPLSKKVIDDNSLYFTKRLIHLYNFVKNSPARYINDIEIADDIEKQILKSVLISHFLLYDKGVCDYINEKISKFVSPANEIKFMEIQHAVMSKIISGLCYSIYKTREESYSENDTIESLPILLITNHECIYTVLEHFKTSNIVEEMILSAKQECNSAKSIS